MRPGVGESRGIRVNAEPEAGNGQGLRFNLVAYLRTNPIPFCAFRVLCGSPDALPGHSPSTSPNKSSATSPITNENSTNSSIDTYSSAT